jgi:hypothetical protein
MAHEAETQTAQDSQEPQLPQEDVQAALKPENVRQMKIAMVTLATCIVEALNETDEQYAARFVGLLDKAFDNYRNNSDADPQHVLEVIHWTREMLRGWNPVPGCKESIFGQAPEKAPLPAE